MQLALIVGLLNACDNVSVGLVEQGAHKTQKQVGMFGPLGTCMACSDSEVSSCVFPAHRQQQQALKSEELVFLPEAQSARVTFLAVPMDMLSSGPTEVGKGSAA